MNVLLAFLIFLGINFFHGTWQSTLEVTVVNDCVIPAGRVPATCQMVTHRPPPNKPECRSATRWLPSTGTPSAIGTS